MPQPEQFQEKAGQPVLMTTKDWRVRALQLLGILAMGMSLAACGRCGEFLPSSLGQSGACHSDPPPQQ